MEGDIGWVGRREPDAWTEMPIAGVEGGTSSACAAWRGVSSWSCRAASRRVLRWVAGGWLTGLGGPALCAGLHPYPTHTHHPFTPSDGFRDRAEGMH